MSGPVHGGNSRWHRQGGISRRAFLGGAGAVVALPWLESLLGRSAHAASPPRRLLVYYVPCGIYMAAWTPQIAGSAYALSPILQPLSALKDDLLVLTGLANLPAKPDGPGDHAGGTSAFLTCTHVKKSDTDIQNAVSMDQLVARQIGPNTRFSSLQFGIEGGSSAGGCDSGYSCAYTRNISWAGPKTPLPKTISPQVAFDLLFRGVDNGATQAEIDKRKRYKVSVLDYVLADAQRLQGRLGQTDRQKLDEYLSGVRELEGRIQGTGGMCQPGTRPADAAPAYIDQVKQMADLMVLALQCDMTRVITFMLNNGGTGRDYSFLPGVTGAHHQLSHHMGNPVNLAQLQTIDTWEVQQLAYLCGRMKQISEGAGSMLDNSIVVFSSEIEDGNAHRHTNLPVLVLGKGGGALKPGRHVIYDQQPPLANLYISLLNALGVNARTFGDNGTAPLTGLTG